ncbi:MAG: BON domain-containing protein [Bdellovibrionota bacterium]
MFKEPYDHDEDGHYEGPENYPTKEEIDAAVQMILFLEHDLGVDVRRIRVKVRGGVVHLQGSVQSHELLREIERIVPTRPNVIGVESYLSVDDARY